MSVAQRKSNAPLDWVLLSLFGAIVFIGWLMLYTVSYEGNGGLWFSFDSIVGQQTLWLGVALVAFIVCYSLDWRIWNTLAFPIYIVCVISLVLVLFIGKEVKGASSWFELFGYSFQPSELAKWGTTLGVAAFLAQPNLNMNNLGKVIQVFLLFMVPAGLVFLQPDAGTAIIFASFLIPLFRAGLNPLIHILILSLAFIFIGSLIWDPFAVMLIIVLAGSFVLAYTSKDSRLPLSILLLLSLFAFASYGFINYFYLFALVGIGFLYFMFLAYKEAKYSLIALTTATCLISIFLSFGTTWAFKNVLKPHQRDRLNVWLKPELTDPHGALYNIIQSKTAIGSGGISGKGFLDGTMTRLNYVPEQSTDFIFSILGEEQGFIGSVSLIFLMTGLLLRLTMVGERATLPFVKYYAYSMAGILFFHFFINIGMTVGLMPVIGIPLPLMSKGGSSLVTFFIMMAILLKMDQTGRRV